MKTAEQRRAARNEAKRTIAELYAKRHRDSNEELRQARENALTELVELRLRDETLQELRAGLVTVKADAARRATRDADLNTQQIADALGMTRAQVSNYLNGVTSPEA